ncbi:unnamed protein product [Caenorhabditis angaria]|uniref:Serpentine receptor class gamma n=1 Tax=Caenorhabditis angaria TaxID=860376 RepID=A0A9P1II73_9PELO|nr:unnamed protein product [Caenorhabditis angaria]
MNSGNSSFFVIYTIDSIASITILCFDIFFSRILIYIIPLCPIITPFFYESSIIAKISLFVPNYMKAMKAVTQIFMSINRMCCVLYPLNYTQKWKYYMKPIIFIITLSPNLVTWNLLISRPYLVQSFGGFAFSYLKKVSWAKLSTFHLTFVTISMFFTFICTTVTLFKLIMLPERIKRTEKTLCIATIIISIGFTAVAINQFMWAFCAQCQTSGLLYSVQFLCYDLVNIGSPIVIILISRDLRRNIFKKQSSISIVRMVTSQF